MGSWTEENKPWIHYGHKIALIAKDREGEVRFFAEVQDFDSWTKEHQDWTVHVSNRKVFALTQLFFSVNTLQEYTNFICCFLRIVVRFRFRKWLKKRKIEIIVGTNFFIKDAVYVLKKHL